MKIEYRLDYYNHNKIWILKKSKCNHYYIAQIINNNYKFVRVRKAHYYSIFRQSDDITYLI